MDISRRGFSDFRPEKPFFGGGEPRLGIMARNMVKRVSDPTSMTARTKLLEAGAALFFDHSFESVSVGEITKAAGVAHGLLFHYFGTKLDFYVEVYSRFVADLHERRVVATASGSPEQRLRKFIQMHMQVFRQRGEAHTYHARGGTHAKVVAVSEASRHEGVLLLLSFFTSSPPLAVDQLMCRAWLDLMDELILAWIENPDVSEGGVIDVCVELLHEALGRAHLLLGRRETASVGDLTPLIKNQRLGSATRKTAATSS